MIVPILGHLRGQAGSFMAKDRLVVNLIRMYLDHPESISTLQRMVRQIQECMQGMARMGHTSQCSKLSAGVSIRMMKRLVLP